MIEKLRKQGVSETLLKQVAEFLETYKENSDSDRVLPPAFTYYGKDVWEDAISAILAGENLLLYGPKATGKNVLADNLAWLFKRPSWNISFHINTDSGNLIGTDTFKNGAVEFRKGPIAECAEHGGFGILDEINMARNDAVAVLHATLDYRRLIDLPGYDRITLRPETRFIATMNYGYIGTRELNEALTSRFMVIKVPTITRAQLILLLKEQFPKMKDEFVEQISSMFDEVQKKSDNAEISTKPVDLRGLLASVRLIQTGLAPSKAFNMGLVFKTFDPFEQEIVRDVISMRIPESLRSEDFFEI